MTHNAADRQLIFETVARFAFGYDDADFELMAAAFTADATSQGTWATGKLAWGPMIGRDDIVSVLSAIREKQADKPRHNITNFLFTEQTEATAEARFYLDLNSTVEGKTSVVSAGKYEAEFIREGDVWRLKRLDAALDRTN
jgi:hypothetical protein